MPKYLRLKKIVEFKASKPKFSGFTLIETLVYIAVLSVLLIAISNLILGTIGNYKNSSIRDELASSAYQVFGMFFREVKNADSVYLASSVLDNDSGELSLTTPFQFGGGTGSAGQADFYLSAGRIMFRREGETPLVLTPDDIEITRFRFVRVIPRTGLEGIRFYLSLKSKIKPEEVFSLTTFTVLRGGYTQ